MKVLEVKLRNQVMIGNKPVLECRGGELVKKELDLDYDPGFNAIKWISADKKTMKIIPMSNVDDVVVELPAKKEKP